MRYTRRTLESFFTKILNCNENEDSDIRIRLATIFLSGLIC